MPVGTPGAENARVSLESTEVVSAGSTWSYRDNGREAPGWEASSFDDSSWSRGASPLGYGDSQTTVVSYGGDANDKHITTWFRRQVSVEGAVVGAELGLRADDGALVYLNGEEIVRHNLPDGDVTADTLATATVYGSGESTYFSYDLDTSGFVDGENTLAVEVHQAASNSSDLTFDLSLSVDVVD